MIRSLSHPNIVEYYELDDVSRSDKLYLFMELADGSLEEGLPSTDFAQQRGLLKLLSQQLLLALQYLQSVQVAHHDIKPANILYKWQPNGDLVFKLADFGVAERYEEEGCLSFFGTPSYQPPEVVRNVDGSPFDGVKADLWSLGITLYQLVYGKLPFQGETVYLVMKSIDEDKVHFPSIVHHGSRQLQRDNELLLDFLRALLTKDVISRPSVDEFLRHPWINSISTLVSPSEPSSACCTIA